ncbi:hypothetical protein [Lactobacillus iners]|jgi:hypothetical protein|uniref:hypothetical protein n=1 Tax=Lactobacillus iners TaxID=147802 RepID=UPI0001E9858D|nr:hypothetical protein [Lactobacillus iners]EFQ48966.1 hypothetical protein HMPREF9217_1046 [Lactobacillus iners LEAF 2052A-d]MCT7675501.1 hypothetical protein [Lactobacillus iners]
MRFSDLFISYKIGLKDIKSSIPFTELPLYRKIFIIIFLTGIIISGILLIFKQNIFSFIPIGLSLISLIIFAIIDSKKSNLSHMLENYYIPYSEKRMDMIIEVLKKYKINIENADSLDMLITEAKYAQAECDFLSQFEKPFKTLGAIIIPIVVFIVKKISESATPTDVIKMAALAIILILLIFSLIFSFVPIIKDLFYRDYNKYTELMYDLRQVKLFYTKKSN